MAHPKDIVERGYDDMAERYARARKLERRDMAFLGLLFGSAPAGGRVLDLGCGNGLPLTKMMAERYSVTGVDISGRQIERARRNLPGVEFIKADMAALDFPDGTFDAIASYLAILHVPKEEKPALYANIFRMLKPGGALVMMIGPDEWDSVPGDGLMGIPMYWSQLGEGKTRALLESIGFAVAHASMEAGGLEGQPECHLLMMAVKPQ